MPASVHAHDTLFHPTPPSTRGSKEFVLSSLPSNLYSSLENKFVHEGHEGTRRKNFVPLRVLGGYFHYRKNHDARQRKSARHINNKSKKIPPPPHQYARRIAIRRLRQNILSSLRFDRRPLIADRRIFFCA
jgi:hypothetical protein